MAEPRVVVVGAGPAGLAAARELQRRGIAHRLLEKGSGAGHTWANLYDSLTLHTGKHLSKLPGLPLGRKAPLFPARDDFIAYLQRYTRTFGLEVEAGTEVIRAQPSADGGPWRLETTAGRITADVLVVATGILANPVVPVLPGAAAFRGEILHSIAYRRPQPFAGRRVLVVGVGNSGGEIASELADAGVEAAVAVRSGANVVPLTLAGLPIQYVAAALWKMPVPVRDAAVAAVRRITELRRGPPVLPPLDGFDRIPLIGFHLADAIRAGRIRVHSGIETLTPEGASFVDGSAASFDVILLATGYRAALQPLAGMIRTDPRGFALRSDRVISADLPRLLFVGHNYDVTGGLRNIWKDAPIAAERAAAMLRG